MSIGSIDCKALKKLLDNNQAVLIDVREDFEYRLENIAEAILMPLGKVDAELLPDLAGKKLVIQCRSGKRSLAACQKLIEQNPQLEPLNLEGGILAWKAENFSIQNGKRNHPPIPIALQIAIFYSSIFMVLISFGFVFHIAFFGIAAIYVISIKIAKNHFKSTRTSFLVKLFEKMPWNRSK